MADLLADPAITAVNVVTTPEEMPVDETIDLVRRARAELEVPLGSVIVNRVLPELFTHDRTRRRSTPCVTGAARDRLDAELGAGAGAVLDAARLAVSLRRSRSVHLAELRDAVDLPLCTCPYLFVRDHGLRVTRMVADASRPRRLGQ